MAIPLHLLLLALAAEPASADRLQADRGTFESFSSTAYAAGLTRLLLPHRFRQVQMVVTPAFGAEWAVYVFRTRGQPARVVATRLQRSLGEEAASWLATQPRPEEGKQSARLRERAYWEVQPAVQRFEAPISDAVVDRLKLVWKASLLEIRLEDESSVGRDGTTYVFSDLLEPIGFRSGRTWSPENGTRCGSLVQLGEQLSALAMAPAAQRPAIEAALVKESDALLARFNSASRPTR